MLSTAAPAVKKTREEINSARRADYAAHRDEMRLKAKAWRRRRKGLLPLDTPAVTTIQEDLTKLKKKIFDQTGLYASITVAAVER